MQALISSLAFGQENKCCCRHESQKQEKRTFRVDTLRSELSQTFLARCESVCSDTTVRKTSFDKAECNCIAL